MANNIQGVNLEAIAELSLDFLGQTFAPLTAVARDFTGDPSGRGESVVTRYAAGLTAQDLSGGYAANDINSTSVTVQLNQLRGYSMGFSDYEVSRAAGDVQWLTSIFLQPAYETVLDSIFTDIVKLVVSGNFTNATTSTASAFDSDDIADISSAMSGRKVPRGDRNVILSPSYYAAVQKDSVVGAANTYGGTEAVREYSGTRVHGMNLWEYTGAINSASATTTSENLQGFALHPSAIAVAARFPAAPADSYVQVLNLTSPDVSQTPLQLRSWYDATAGKHMVSVACLYGVAKGHGDSLQRIKSA
jgi:hypothetical protein